MLYILFFRVSVANVSVERLDAPVFSKVLDNPISPFVLFCFQVNNLMDIERIDRNICVWYSKF